MTIGVEPAALGVDTRASVDSWLDVPPASTDYDAANAALQRHVHALLDSLQKHDADPQP